MAWYLDSVRIFVQDASDNYEQIIAQLYPVGGETVNQIFGYKDLITNLSAIIVGFTDKSALIAMTQTGVTYTLSGAGSTLDTTAYYGEYFVKSTKFTQKSSTCQTIRTDLPEGSPVFVVDLELIVDTYP